MDKSAPWSVLQGTLVISAVSATATGFLGILRGQQHNGMLAAGAALNSGVTAGVFFGLREFIIAPVLVHTIPTAQYQRRRIELGPSSPSTTPEIRYPSETKSNFSDVRTNKLLDSALSGAATGGILRGWRSGPRAVLPGALTVSAICALLQLGYNEISVRRLKYISRQHHDQHPTLGTESARKSIEDHTSEQDAPTGWKRRMLSVLGVRRMSEDEYLERLKLQREHHLRRIRELEAKLEEERNHKE